MFIFIKYIFLIISGKLFLHLFFTNLLLNRKLFQENYTEAIVLTSTNGVTASVDFSENLRAAWKQSKYMKITFNQKEHPLLFLSETTFVLKLQNTLGVVISKTLNAHNAYLLTDETMKDYLPVSIKLNIPISLNNYTVSLFVSCMNK